MAYTTIKKPSDYFNTKIFTGTGATNSITGVGFQPDWTWIKNRTTAASNHRITDAVRGVTKEIYSDLTAAEATNTDGLTAFGSDGFTVGSNADYNGNGNNIVSWNWLANGAGSANTDGSISSTVSANTTSGFSIVSYTGTGANATVGHGLGVAPSLIITKARTNAGRFWGVYSKSLGNTGVMALNSTQAFDTSTTYWNDTTPSSSVFTVGTNGDTNSASGMIAYCFADVQGYSKFGSYTGNGSTDGTFVYTGFKPAFVMVKNTNNATADWTMFDVKRNTYNIMDKRLRANLSNAEDAPLGFIDFTSNGFKWRTDSFAVNGSGNTMIYMAFAEEPLVGDNPATAR